MSYLVLARKWRPQSFAEVIGQSHVVRVLESALRSGRIAHAYVFAGPRGVGKTSIARILAKSLNCEQGPTPEPCGVCRSCTEIQGGSNFDVIEIDGASNNSVNDIRELRGNVKYGPSEFRWKVYIIDEVHMLSTSAFNALLKTLEEPPPNTVFIFATTELHKLPLTVLSRCQRFDFQRLSPAEIERSLQRVCAAEGVEVEERTLRLLARRADGGMRDAQSLLDQVLSFSGGRVVHEEVVQGLGLVEQERVEQLLAAVVARDGAAAFRLARELSASGADLAEVLLQVAEALRNLLLLGVDEALAAEDLPAETLEGLRPWAAELGEGDLLRMLSFLGSQIDAIKRGGNTRLRFELTLLRLVRMERALEVEALVQALSGLPAAALGTVPAEEKKTLRGGADPVTRPRKPTAPAGGDPAAEPPRLLPEAEPPALLERIRSRWPAVREEVARRQPLLDEAFHALLPVAFQAGVLTLKGDLGSPLERQHIERLQPALEEAVAAGLGGDWPGGARLELVSGELTEEERFLPVKRTRIDARGRLEELAGEHPLVEDLFQRMDGRLLDGQ
jgi:DNA polymerase III subunit gamma/tau